MIEPVVQGAQRMVWGVASLVHALSDALAARFSVCSVHGEISNFTRAATGHCYLTLKDADGAAAAIRCAMFRRAATLLDFEPADGQLVELRGKISIYFQRGELQFIVESMRQAGEGVLFERFLKLKAALEAEGLFDPARKRKLPEFPRRIGVATSLGAAALHDVLTALARRAPHIDVVVYPCIVQGADAPAAIVKSIEAASSRGEVDVLIVCRGGGSLQDLLAFNDERVVRAVVACSVPVVCGVGHETDVTLVDFAADLRAPTPTAAAELVAPKRSEQIEMIAGMGMLLKRSLHRQLDRRLQLLDRISQYLGRRRDELLGRARNLQQLHQRLVTVATQYVPREVGHVAHSQSRLSSAAREALTRRRQHLSVLEGRLRGMDPHQVLARGFAWITGEDGRAITSASQLSPGQSIRAVLDDGEASATVNEVFPKP